MGVERTAGKAWTRAVTRESEAPWIEVLRAQGQAVFSPGGLRTLLTIVPVVLLSSVVSGALLIVVLALMLVTYTGISLDASLFVSHPETAATTLLVLAGVLLGGGLDVTFQGAQIAQGSAYSQIHLTGLVMTYLLVLWWWLRGVYRRSCRSEGKLWSWSEIVARASWEGLFTAIVVVPALGFWAPVVDLPQSVGVTLQTRWWSIALTVFLLVFLAALTARLQWSRAPERGLIEVAIDEVRRLAVTLIVVFTVAATAVSAMALAFALSKPREPGGAIGIALTMADPAYLGFTLAAVVLGGGIITWSTMTEPFTALVETPSPFTVGFGTASSGALVPLLVGLCVLALFPVLRLVVVLGLRRRAADDALTARDLSEGRPSGAEEGQVRSWELIRARRRRVGRAVALPVLVTVLLVILQLMFVNAISWFEPVMTPPAAGPAPGYSSGMTLPWYLPLFGGGFAAVISAGAAWIPTALEGAPWLIGLLAWRTPELTARRFEPRAVEQTEDRPGARGPSPAARDAGSGEVQIRELEYDGPVPDAPFRGRE